MSIQTIRACIESVGFSLSLTYCIKNGWWYWSAAQGVLCVLSIIDYAHEYASWVKVRP